MPRTLSLSRGDISKTRAFRRLAGRALTLSYGDIPGRRVPGGAVIISKKVARNAATRNRLKRALRPMLARALRDGAPSIIIVIRSAIATRDLQSELDVLLKKACAPYSAG